MTEREDKISHKILIYFHGTDVMLINRIDLLPYVDFDVDVEQWISYAREINPSIRVFQLSSKTNEGLDDGCKWIASLINI